MIGYGGTRIEAFLLILLSKQLLPSRQNTPHEHSEAERASSLPTAPGFYLDFIALPNDDGRIFVLKYKGANRLISEDIAEKTLSESSRKITVTMRSSSWALTVQRIQVSEINLREKLGGHRHNQS